MAKPMSVSRLRIAPATLIAGSLAALMLSACGGGATAKAGAQRQVDLVRIVLTGPAVLQRNPLPA